MKNKINQGIFCEIYGNTPRNKALEYMLECKDLNFSVRDIAKWLSISKPRMYQIMKELEKQRFIKKTRIVSGTQLYSLNKEDPKVKLLQKNFKECLGLVVDEYKEKPKHLLQNKKIALTA